MSNEVSTQEVPAWLATQEDFGKEALDTHIIPPRCKIVQKQSDDDMLAEFGVGTAVVMPQRDVLAEEGGIIEVIPVFFFAEFLAMNGIESRGTLPMIAERSLDPKGELASKCRNAKYRNETVDGNSITNAEVLNFVCMIDMPNNQFHGTPIVFGFMKAEYMTGASFCSKIKLRKGPICASRFSLSTVQRNNSKGTWYGFSISNPIRPYVEDEAQFNILKGLHAKYKAAVLEINYEDEPAN